MTGLARRPLAVFVCCLFAGMPVSRAVADEATPPSSTEDCTYQKKEVGPGKPPCLRLERKFNVLGKERAPFASEVGVPYPVALRKGDEYPLFVIADKIEGRTDDVTVATGDAELRKLGSLVFAEKMTYWPLEDVVEAMGSVRVLQDGAEFDTPYLRTTVSGQIGYAKPADYHILRAVESKFYRPMQTVVTVATSNAMTTGAPMMLSIPNSYGLPTTSPGTRPSEASGHAVQVDFEGENKIRLTTATYSTCKPGQTDWYLQSPDIHLDYDNQVGDASNASVWFKDVPIFYTPVASFSLNNQRHSGFLGPSYVFSSTNGLDLTVPYYWAIAPNYEATLYPRYLSRRGFQLGAETQYLDYNYRGVMRAEYMPDDQIAQRSRYAYNIQHQQNLGQGFSAVVNWQAVSDSMYWQDMSSRLLQTSQVQLPQQLVLGYTPVPWLQTSTQFLRYQTLQTDPANPVARPYFIEPQINVFAFKPNFQNTDLAMVGQFSRFTNPSQVEGDRLVLYPQITIPIMTPAFQITPKVGVHMTEYSLSQQVAGEPTSISRVLPIVSLDSTMSFEREGNWQGKDYIQTLEPRLYYVNIPYRNQSNIPIFDTGLSDFNFAQIFSENRYSGYDRINDANQLTAAVTTRILNATTGAEQFNAMLGQRYYFKPQQVTIPGESARPANFSNIVAAATGLVMSKTYADSALEYNYHDGFAERFSAGLRYQPELGKVLSGSYLFNRDPLTNKATVDQIDLAGQWPVSARWSLVGRFNWSFSGAQLLEGIGGVEYTEGCWAMRVVIQRLEAVAGTPSTNVFLQLELSDFTSVGATPIGLLRRTIPGYGKVNELPNSGTMFNSQ